MPRRLINNQAKDSALVVSPGSPPFRRSVRHTTEKRMGRSVDDARPLRGRISSVYRELLAYILGANLKSVTLAVRSMQAADIISYLRMAITVVNRAALEKASCECYAIVKERFDAFLKPPSTAVQGNYDRCPIAGTTAILRVTGITASMNVSRYIYVQ